MAFNTFALDRVDGLPFNNNWWTYQTPDSQATVLADGYFPAYRIEPGDVIKVISGTEPALASFDVVVTSNAGGIVSVSLTGGGGSVDPADIDAAIDARAGVDLATLDGGKLSPAQIPDSLTAGLNNKGVWDASTNTPTLADGVGTNGDFYTVAVGGTVLGETWAAGDQAIYNGSVWQRAPGRVPTAAEIADAGSKVIMTTTERTKLAGVEAGAVAAGATGDAFASSHPGTGGAAHAVATTGTAGFMSSTDKQKLNSVETGAVAAGAAGDSFASTHPGTGGTAHAAATTGAAGFMSAADKAKLDGVAANANAAGVAGDAFASSHPGTGGAAHAAATTSVAGFMSAADKVKLDGAQFFSTENQTKLDGIEAGATANPNAVDNTRQILTTNSLTGGGALTADRTIQLVNDSAAPGNDRVYGTSSTGVKGWRTMPAATADQAQVDAAVAVASYTPPGTGAAPRLYGEGITEGSVSVKDFAKYGALGTGTATLLGSNASAARTALGVGTTNLFETLDPNDTADGYAFLAAMLECRARGGGLMTVPRGHYIINRPFWLDSNITMRGEGPGVTIIENTWASGTGEWNTNHRPAAFFAGLHHPTSFSTSNVLLSYSLANTNLAKGQRFVTLNDSADAGNFTGNYDQVWVWINAVNGTAADGVSWYLAGSSHIPARAFPNRVVAVSGAVLTLEYPIKDDLASLVVGDLKISRMGTNTAPTYGRSHTFSVDSGIENLTLISPKKITGENGWYRGWMRDVECISGDRGIIHNCLFKCDLRRVRITYGGVRAYEAKGCSHDNYVEDMRLTQTATASSTDTAASAIDIGESSEGNTYVRMTLAESGAIVNTVPRVTVAGDGNTFEDLSISGYRSTLLQLKTHRLFKRPPRLYFHGRSSVDARGANTARWLQINTQAGDSFDPYVEIDGLVVSGTVTATTQDVWVQTCAGGYINLEPITVTLKDVGAANLTRVRAAADGALMRLTSELTTASTHTSGATLDLTGATSAVVALASTGNITAINNAPVGKPFSLVMGNGNATFVNGASLVCPGATNLNPASGAVLLGVRIGNVVYLAGPL